MTTILRASLLAVALPALSILPGPTHAQQAVSDAAFDAYLSARFTLGQFNGTAVVVSNGDVVLDRGYGFTDVHAGTPATSSTQYRLASLTKAFTAAAILQLQEAGRLTLSDPACRWIDNCPAAWSPITITHLLRHTSGVPDYEAALEPESETYRAFMSATDSAMRIVDRQRALPLDFAPGARFAYSNTGYIVLGLIVERASGLTFDRYLDDRILGPAGLRATTTAASPSGLSVGHSRVSGDIREIAAGITVSPATVRADAALPFEGPHADAKLVGTAADLWRWLDALDRGIVISSESLQSMLTPGPGNYGLGWYISSRWGQRVISHTGFLPGYASVIEWYPDSRSAVILTTNMVGPRLPLVARDLGAALFGRPYDVRVPRKAVALDRTGTQKLEGRYTLDDGRTATVTLGDELLTVSVPGAFNAGTFPVGRDEFYAPFLENTVQFERDEMAAGLRIRIRFFGETWNGRRAATSAGVG